MKKGETGPHKEVLAKLDKVAPSRRNELFRCLVTYGNEDVLQEFYGCLDKLGEKELGYALSVAIAQNRLPVAR